MFHYCEYKIYPNKATAEKLRRWMKVCAWVYNRALEQRMKAWKRRKQSVFYYDQQKLLTLWRSKMPWIEEVPCEFLRGALRRVDRGMKDFFRRVKNGEKPGFPRFKACDRWKSMESIMLWNYVGHRKIRVLKTGWIRARGKKIVAGKQKGVRIVRKINGWYAQIIVDSGTVPPEKKVVNDIKRVVGLDLGIESFFTTSNGLIVENPKILKSQESKIKRLQRRVSRRNKGSKRRRKAARSCANKFEIMVSSRKTFCHRLSTDLSRNFDLISVEKLNIAQMAEGKHGKSIKDAGWGIFLSQLRYKVEYTGSRLVEVDPKYTSQECPQCGAVNKKQIWLRNHACECGCKTTRDHASAVIILNRGLKQLNESLVLAGDNARRDGLQLESSVKREALKSMQKPKTRLLDPSALPTDFCCAVQSSG